MIKKHKAALRLYALQIEDAKRDGRAAYKRFVKFSKLAEKEKQCILKYSKIGVR